LSYVLGVELPTAIRAYFDGANAFDADHATFGFAPDAIVHDEREDHVGHAAIRAWIADTIARYATQFAVVDAAEATGVTHVRVTMSGTFPGSPVTVQFSFRLEGDRIQYLDIG
jgi:hypothetical protein